MRWQGSVYPKGGSLYFRVKVDGAWRGVSSGFAVGQESEAAAALAKVRDRLWAEEDARGRAPVIDSGPMTVRAWSKLWLVKREHSRVDDDRHLRLHILPTLGPLRLSEVRPRHVLEVVDALRGQGRAARTVRNVYSTAQAMFRDAMLRDLIATNPCILRKPHLPTIVDRDPEWRQGAVFTRDELVTLISPHPAIEADSTVSYALLGLAALRHGEMAGLRWRHYDATMAPLGRLVVSTSYGKGRTKTGAVRWMPVHPVLAAALAEWRLTGWQRFMRRAPTDDDLILPLCTTSRRKEEIMRRKDFTWKRADRHLRNLGLAHRRVHDLRRTFISLVRHDGADREVLKRGTHAPPKDVIELYTSVEWARLCGEVAKLNVSRRSPREREGAAALATLLPKNQDRPATTEPDRGAAARKPAKRRR